MNGKNKKTPYAIFLVVICLLLAGCSDAPGSAVDPSIPVESTNAVADTTTAPANAVADTTTAPANAAEKKDTKNSVEAGNTAPPGGSMNPEEMKKKGESMGMNMEDMMKMGESMGMSREDMMNMGGSSSMPSGHYGPSTETAPKLQNLMMQNLGPWDSSSATFGDLIFDARYSKTVFDDFGMLHNPGAANQYDNPTFEFKAPADAIVIAPIRSMIQF